MASEKRFSGGFSGAVERAPMTQEGHQIDLALDVADVSMPSPCVVWQCRCADEYAANAGDWVEALDGMRLENRMGSNGFSIAADAGPSGEEKKAP